MEDSPTPGRSRQMTHDTTELRRDRGPSHVTWRGVFASESAALNLDPGGFDRNDVSGTGRIRPSRGWTCLERVPSPNRAGGIRRRAGIAGALGSFVRAVLLGLTLFALLPFGSSPVAAETVVHLDGPRLQGGLLRGRVPPDSAVEYAGDAVRVSKDGWFLVGFGRDAPPEAELVVVFPDGRREQQVLKVDRREYDIQHIDGLPARKVTPSEKDLVRIRAEVHMVKQARGIDDPRADFLGGFRWPIKGRISGVYGSQRILNGEPRRPHFGIDIAAPTGTKVGAPADGVVTMVHPDMFFSGGTMIVDHGHGLSSAFLHLSRILVEKGDRVVQGQAIAEVGSTGRSTGPHLDWRINLFDRRLDPSLLVGPMPK